MQRPWRRQTQLPHGFNRNCSARTHRRVSLSLPGVCPKSLEATLAICDAGASKPVSGVGSLL